jgi:hypothetical protein
MSEPFSRARWKISSGDFFGIADNRWSRLDETKSLHTRKRRGTEEIDKERVPGYRRGMSCEKQRRRTEGVLRDEKQNDVTKVDR